MMRERTGEAVAAGLNYAVAGGTPAVFHASSGDEGRNRVEGRLVRQCVTIADGRQGAEDLTLDRAGFALVRHHSAVSDFHEQGQLNDIYAPEVARLVQGLTGADRTLVFDHTCRTDCDRIRAARRIRDHVPLVHNDYTERSARQRLRDLVSPAEAERLLAARFAIVNVWRSIGGPAETSPLALCDARSIADGDLLAMERRANDRIGEMQQATFAARHRWVYFPHMDRDEALVFKTFDSALDGRARRSLHCAFVNPVAAADAAPRVSIESRVLAFFGES